MPIPFIDTHVHILPGIDDGAQSMDEACQMAAAAVADGITAVIATPHCLNGTYSPERGIVLEAVAELQVELDRRQIPLVIIPGSELHCHDQLRRLLDEGMVLPLFSGPYLLLEWPSTKIPPYMDSLIFELMTGGYRPIIAHPERHPAIQENPNRLFRWIERGALAQVTAGSVTGVFGESVRELTKVLVTHGMVQLIATDAHGIRGRKPILSEAFQVVSEWVGEEEALKLVSGNPQAVLDGRSITVDAQVYLKPRSGARWLRWLGVGR